MAIKNTWLAAANARFKRRHIFCLSNWYRFQKQSFTKDGSSDLPETEVSGKKHLPRNGPIQQCQLLSLRTP